MLFLFLKQRDDSANNDTHKDTYKNIADNRHDCLPQSGMLLWNYIRCLKVVYW
ncbi:hypothetical protein XBJ2_140016 [Xenorhabdus bovienii str. Jollieti]|uniref:Uncharacterized protein n=1 Tax=Xenorhabdus bovienii (strain SS-2004) TaxID=406818 RepID=D3UW92_XENBS|nr:hypothetical protein XBJ1_0451 [Xenorhabdus bovienii SS-2004]CDH27673.1 hypothetical protein XBJ2_140016 [Xenorhabdus bovienii str. Jollieti]